MNEAETRAEYIDPALKAAGWGVVEGSYIRREFPVTAGRIEAGGKRGAALSADYVLFYRNTKLGVIEAKARDKHYTEGVGQAKNYARMLDVRYTYATNGLKIYGIDMGSGHEADVAAYPTPDELWARTYATPNAWRDRFATVPFEDKGGSHPSRYYQDVAVSRVMEAVSGGRQRILLTLATGTGKTFIAFQIAWKLFHSRWNVGREPTRQPRILFLADRNGLADQAFNNFSAFAEDALVRIDPAGIRKKQRVPKNGSIFFTIFQTFMSGRTQTGEPAPYFGGYPPDFFDLIIIDECHRGGAKDESRWRGILDYFSPAVHLGLTATPKRAQNADTYAYFGEPVYIYSLKEGINDGFLTPFRVKQIATTLDTYVYTPDDIVLEGEVSAGDQFGESDFNRTIEIDEREVYRVNLFMGMVDQREKSIVFCATQAHAAAIRNLINQVKTNPDPHYCERVTANDGELGEQFLRAFQDNEKTIPTMLTTSQKLSTGVDARNIRNIVLLRPVASMIEFKQIIGRGTRLYEGKDYFTIYDFVGAHVHFSDPEWDGEPLPPEAPEPPAPPRSPPTIQPGSVVGDSDALGGAVSRIRVQLADGKARSIQSMVRVSFWHPDGTPMSAQQFVELLFGKLPTLCPDLDSLRARWSDPATRAKLLADLAEAEFGAPQLAEMARVLGAENSDTFDVLAHVAFATAIQTRAERAARARVAVVGNAQPERVMFIEFVLDQYIRLGVGELAREKLAPLLNLRYGGSLADAIAKLGDPAEVAALFVGFQRHLYTAEASNPTHHTPSAVE